MGWIKAHLDEATHEALRKETEKTDKRIHEVAGDLLKERLETTESYMEGIE